MKRTIGIATSLLVATSLLASPTAFASNNEKADADQANVIQERELNDTFNSANQTLKSNDYLHGTFAKNDKDIYKVELTGKDEHDLIISIGQEDDKASDMNFHANVYDSDGNKIKPYDVGAGSYFRSSYLLKAGTYYIEASDLNNVNNGKVYELNAAMGEVEKAIYRISGSDRYETAAKMAFQNRSNATAESVVLVSGENFPDALSGTPLAYELDAEMLLAQQSKLPEVTKEALKSLKTKKVTIVGGEGAISKEVEDVIEDDLGLKVDRISGKDRYATAAAVAEKLSSDQVAVVNGKGFADALSVAAYAARSHMPILLTETDQIPEATKKALEKYEHSLAVGGKGVISDEVVDQLPDTERLAGKDRYATSVAVAEYFDWSPSVINLAKGSGYADALTGSLRSAYLQAPLLLTPDTKLVPSTTGFLDQEESFKYTILGGKGAVSESVELEIVTKYF